MRSLTLQIALVFMIFTKLHAYADPIQSTKPPETEDSAADIWSYSATSYIYMVPDDENYVSLIFTANQEWLHLEGRYNYEDLRTGSAWIGYNFSFGNKLVFEATPMFGGVFGDLNGVAPGAEITLSYSKLEFYTENEYIFDLEDSSGNFFYTWSELTYSPMDWFQFGIVVQRTKAYQTELDIQRGVLVGFSHKMLNVTAYVFNPGWDKPTFSIAAGLNF